MLNQRVKRRKNVLINLLDLMEAVTSITLYFGNFLLQMERVVAKSLLNHLHLYKQLFPNGAPLKNFRNLLMPKLLEFKVQKEIVRFSAIFLLIFLFSIFKGSGWCWLIHSPVSKKLELITTPNQD